MYFGLSGADFYNILIKLKTGDTAPPISTSVFSSPPTEKGSGEKRDHVYGTSTIRSNVMAWTGHQTYRTAELQRSRPYS